MEFDLDKAIKEMCLEEDKPLILKNNPKFSSVERNVNSIMGRLLNPECQKMSSMILDMPRVWRLYNRVRGVALSRKNFQFIFDSEADLQTVLEAGVWTYDDWGMVLERWVANPPEDYLKKIPVWIRLRNLPVNHYTYEAIMEIADTVGVVKVVAFDPLKPQSRGFVRAQVSFDVMKPLRNSKVVQTDNGEVVQVNIEYERLRKRCYQCQRLSHDKTRCPFNPLNRQRVSFDEVKAMAESIGLRIPKISKDDPLYGVLTDDDVGIDFNTGRPKIAKEVLDEMRCYLSVDDPTEKKARIERVRRSIWNLEGDPLGKKTLLRLEAATEITSDIDKGKGLVYQFGENASAVSNMAQGEQLPAGKIQVGSVRSRLTYPVLDRFRSQSQLFEPIPNSTVFRPAPLLASSSGIRGKVSKNRNRPNKWKRQAQSSQKLVRVYKEKRKDFTEEFGVAKRKAADEAEVPSKLAKHGDKEVVPHEELPHQV